MGRTLSGWLGAFEVEWRQENPIHTQPRQDWNYVEVRGAGVFVGDTLAVTNPVKTWWGEGDEKIYVDGETFPSHFGTGTEDYYGYAWGSPEPFEGPFHAQPRCDGPDNYGHTTVSRVRILDAIPDEPIALVRNDDNFKKLGLTRSDYDDREAVITLLLEHPELMERPVVFVGDRAVIARPSDKVLELLD